ncbi:hypothetical protein [Actinospongicola halichondriae]|uniref:hypothetical protein n=1 Tax=Actinospongicola halichondriae TaxID=3236844 RepID=UPI003D50429D
MANKNQVTLTFAGDSQDLERSFDKVGKSAKAMGKEADDGFARVGDAADTVDTRAMGFRDTITGVSDSFRGLTDDSLSLEDRLLTLGMGVGDLASGVANFGVDFAKSAGSTVAGWAKMGWTSTVNGAKMAAAWIVGLGPVAWAIAGVVAVIGILAALGVGFDDVKRVASAAWDGIVKAGKTAWDFMSKIFDWLGGVANWVNTHVAEPLRDALLWPFKTAFNAVAGIWNNTVGRLSFTIPGWVPGLGGKGFSMPQIPTFAIGGIVQGMPGSPQLVMAHAGERIVRNSQASNGMSGGTQIIRLEVDGKTLAQVVRANDRDYARLGGR